MFDLEDTEEMLEIVVEVKAGYAISTTQARARIPLTTSATANRCGGFFASVFPVKYQYRPQHNMSTPPASDDRFSIPEPSQQFSAQAGDEILSHIHTSLWGTPVDLSPMTTEELDSFREFFRRQASAPHAQSTIRPASPSRLRLTTAEQIQRFDDRRSATPRGIPGDARSLSGLFYEPRDRAAVERDQLEILRTLARMKTSVPAACEGCANYFGETHGGNTVICGMHPFGPEGDSCEDFEGKK